MPRTASVPARLRSAFEEGIYVTQENERCLGGYSPEEFQRRLVEDVEASAAGSVDRPNVKRRLAVTAVHFPELDKQGRDTCNEGADRCDHVFDPTNGPTCAQLVCGNGALDAGEQ